MVLKLQLKRNKELFENKEAAIEGLSNALAKGNAGEIMIATYKYEDDGQYLSEIPLYNTDGGDTYIDWFNENWKSCLSIGDVFVLEFEGQLEKDSFLMAGTENYALYWVENSSTLIFYTFYADVYAGSGYPSVLKTLTAETTLTGITPYYDGLTLQSKHIFDADIFQSGQKHGEKIISTLDLGQLTLDRRQYPDDIVNKFKIIYKPVQPIKISSSAKDEFNYSDVQYTES